MNTKHLYMLDNGYDRIVTMNHYQAANLLGLLKRNIDKYHNGDWYMELAWTAMEIVFDYSTKEKLEVIRNNFKDEIPCKSQEEIIQWVNCHVT